jgi:tRNA threonylcarbamoyl adenosine modification protein (Sua5/YciO/YrdC/YwlC family)
MTSKQKTVGIRVPDNAICRAIIEELGNPILTTSAVAGDDAEPMTEAYEIEERLGNQLDAIIDGGPVYPAPSSVVSLVSDAVEILRYGKGDTSRFE